jgi:hypothetical protein
MYDIIIGVFIAFGFLIFLLVLKNAGRSIGDKLAGKLVEAGDKAVKAISKIGDIKIEMVSNGSDTTRIPYPALAANCSHIWEPLVDKVLENEDIKKLIYVQKCTMCGLVDKTVEEVTKDKTALPKSECRHKWADQTVALESAFEQMRGRSTWTKKDMKDFDPWFFRKTMVKTLICVHCGEVKTITASNFDIGDENELDS